MDINDYKLSTSVERGASENFGLGKKLTSFFDLTEKFKVIKRYVKKPDDLDSQLAGMSITDGLHLNSTTIFSCLETSRESLSVSYTLDYDGIIAGQVDGVVRIFESHTLKTLMELTDADVSMKAPCTGVKCRPITKDYSGSRNVTCTYANGFIKNWNSKNKECIFSINENRQIFSLTYHPRLPKFLTCGDDAKILLYDEQTKTLERVFQGSEAPGEVDGHVSRVFAVHCNPASNFEFISGGWDDVICYWDIRQPSAIRHISGPHICGDSIDISPDGKEILTCAWQRENQIVVWDYATGKVLRTPEVANENPSKLYCGKYVSDRYIGTGGCNPNLFKILDSHNLLTMALIRGLNGSVYSMDIGDPNRKRHERIRSPLLEIPRIIVSAGKKIYQVDFA